MFCFHSTIGGVLSPATCSMWVNLRERPEYAEFGKTSLTYSKKSLCYGLTQIK